MCESVSPAITPRASGSMIGVRSPAKYGSMSRPLAPDAGAGGQLEQLAVVGRAEELAQPPRDRPGGGHPARDVAGPGAGADGPPQRRARERLRHRVDEEHRRAVHQHQVADALSADAERLRPGVDRAGDDRDALGQPRLRGGVRAHRAGRIARPLQRRELDGAGDLARPRLVPYLLHPVVERRVLARGVMVQDVRAGQPAGEEGARHVQPARPREQLRLGVGDPRHLGPRGLRGQQGAPAALDLARPRSGRSAARSDGRTACRRRRGSPVAAARRPRR